MILFKKIIGKSYQGGIIGYIFYSEQISNYTIADESEINSWGPMNGKGRHIRGVLKSLKLPMEMIVFHAKSEPTPFVIVQVSAQEERHLVVDGFVLIKSAFKKVD